MHSLSRVQTLACAALAVLAKGANRPVVALLIIMDLSKPNSYQGELDI